MIEKTESNSHSQHDEYRPPTEAESERINTAFDRLLAFEKGLSYNNRSRLNYGRRIDERNRLRNEVEQEEFWKAVQNAELDEVWVAMPDNWSYPRDFNGLVTYALDDSLVRMRMLDAFEKLLWQPGWSARSGRVYAPLFWNGTVVEDAVIMTEGERNRMDSIARKDKTDFKVIFPLQEHKNTVRTGTSSSRKVPKFPDHPIFSDLVDEKYDELFNELASWEAHEGKLLCPYTNGDLVNLRKLLLPLLSERPNVKLAKWFISNKKTPLTARGLGKTQYREGGRIHGIVQKALKLLDTSE